MDRARANGLVRARARVTAIFFANGLCIGAWAVAIPEVKALFGLSDAQLSIVLLAAGIGGLTAMPVAGVLPSKIGGTGRALRISGPMNALLLAALPQTHLPSKGMGFLVACAFLFGFINILVDVPMNAHASVIETRWGSAIMSSFHAAWSAGGLIGSAFGGLLIAHGAGPGLQLGIEAGFALAMVVAASVTIGVGDTRAASRVFALPERKLLALGLIAFLAVLVEGAVTDWSALYLRSEVGALSGAAAIGFSSYAFMMIAGRLLGDSVVRAIGRTRTILYGAAILFLGVALATGLVSEPAALVGFALVGLGVANMVPAAFSASAAAASSRHRDVGDDGLCVAPYRATALRRDRDCLQLTRRVCDSAPRVSGNRRVDHDAARLRNLV
jgi:MFS family permease